MAPRFQYQVKTQAFVAGAIVASLNWYQPLSEPPKPKVRLAACQQQSYADYTIQPPQSNLTGVVVLASGQSVVRRDLQFQYQATTIARVPGVIVSNISWWRNFEVPPKPRVSLGTQYQQAYAEPTSAAPVVKDIKWYQELSKPTPAKTGLAAQQQQALAFWPFPITPPIAGPEQWAAPFDQPPKAKPYAIANRDFYAFHPNPLPPDVDGWVPPWDTPPKAKSYPVENRSFFAFYPNPIPPDVDGWVQPWFDPPKPKVGLAAASQQPAAMEGIIAAIITDLRWFEALSEPPGAKAGLRAALQQSLAFTPPQLAEVILLDKWWQNYSLPPKPKAGLGTQHQAQPAIITGQGLTTSIGWYRPLDEPPKPKAGLRTAAQQSLALEGLFPASLVTSIGWFQPYAEVPKPKRGLLPGLQQSLAFTQLLPTEVVTLDKWFRALNEPVRKKLGVLAGLNQPLIFTATPPVIPSMGGWWQPYSDPTRRKFIPQYVPSAAPLLVVTYTQAITMAVTETPDVFFGFLTTYIAPVSANVSVVDIGRTAGNVSIVSS